MTLSVGDRLDPFEIVAPLGSGGMGDVWKARDTRLDRIVAIKTTKTEFSERFASEARAVAALNHPNICHLYDLGKMPDGGSYLVMEYVDGGPIAPVDSPRKLLDLAAQIADGLAAAHAAGFTHRDLKPDNVPVTRPQSPHPGRIKILDFGLAKQTASTATAGVAPTAAALTNPGTVLGTVSYMSPEQARGEPVDARSDQFSFGLIVYELASVAAVRSGALALGRGTVPREGPRLALRLHRGSASRVETGARATVGGQRLAGRGTSREPRLARAHVGSGRPGSACDCLGQLRLLPVPES